MSGKPGNRLADAIFRRKEQVTMTTETADKVGLPEGAREILNKKTFAHVATLMPDGSPQVTPVWVDLDGDDIVINSAEGRVKPKNVRRDPRVSLAAVDPDNPYVNVQVQGRVKELTHDDADDVIDALAKKYLGEDEYPFRQPGEQRVTIRIEPERVSVGN
jgi:PPOX class probable F420-dependent enzyme